MLKQDSTTVPKHPHHNGSQRFFHRPHLRPPVPTVPPRFRMVETTAPRASCTHLTGGRMKVRSSVEVRAALVTELHAEDGSYPRSFTWEAFNSYLPELTISSYASAQLVVVY